MLGFSVTFPPGSAQRQQTFQSKILIIWIGNPDLNRFEEAFLRFRRAVFDHVIRIVRHQFQVNLY